MCVVPWKNATHAHRDKGHLPLKQLNCWSMCAHTHTILTQQKESHFSSAKCLPCSSIIIWQSAATLKSVCFRQFILRTTLFLWGLTAFHWKKCHFRQRHLGGKMMWKHSDRLFRTTITDAISWTLLEQNRLNKSPESGRTWREVLIHQHH